jgi:putative toxin-antitoxin system antitoxin component (TIGR02293 family)
MKIAPARPFADRATRESKLARSGAAHDSGPAGRSPSMGCFEDTPLSFIDKGLMPVIEHQRAGIPATAILVISKKLGLSVDTLLLTLGLPRSTVKSRQASGKNLSAQEAERMVRAARIFKRAAEVFEGEEDARNWLKQPSRALGGKAPLSFMDTDAGYDVVDDELKRIEYGIVV